VLCNNISPEAVGIPRMCGVPPDFAEFGGMGWEGAELELLIDSRLCRMVGALVLPI